MANVFFGVLVALLGDRTDAFGTVCHRWPQVPINPPMASSHNDDKDAVLPDQEGIDWDKSGGHLICTNVH